METIIISRDKLWGDIYFPLKLYAYRGEYGDIAAILLIIRELEEILGIKGEKSL